MPNPNDNDYDIYGVPYKEHEKKAIREYELEKHDRDSCKEIKRRIEADSYKDIEEVREHLEFLENLIDKIRNITQSEEREGIVNLTLKRDFSKIQMLYNDLSMVLDKLEGF